ncbi:hypothetical protein [Clostridium sp. YIM B02551]|nr:hypothetical protein [Clostridium sp. YIM B02551]
MKFGKKYLIRDADQENLDLFTPVDKSNDLLDHVKIKDFYRRL